MVLWRGGGDGNSSSATFSANYFLALFPVSNLWGMPRLFSPQILICHDIPDGGTCMGFGWGGVARIMRDMLNKKTVGTMND